VPAEFITSILEIISNEYISLRNYNCGYILASSGSGLREEHRLREFEKRELRRIFGPKSNEETGGWRKQNNKQLNNLCSSPNTRKHDVKEDNMGRPVACIGRKNAYKLSMGKPE
jgi:hypothetical protein